MSIIIGIDPGTNGGIASNINTIHTKDNKKTIAYKMPDTEMDFIHLMSNMKYVAELNELKVTVILEHVGGFTGGKGQPGSRMFNFGKWFWGPLFTCLTMGFQVELVRPQKWQKYFSLGTQTGMSKTDWKNKLKAEAQRRFPGVNVTLATADALLLLEYGIRNITATE
jgi:hypothetical protein